MDISLFNYNTINRCCLCNVTLSSEFEEVKELFLGLPDTLQEDYEAGIFEIFTEYSTSTGFVLTSIETAITFNNFHEGIHYGIIRSIKKFV